MIDPSLLLNTYVTIHIDISEALTSLLKKTKPQHLGDSPPVQKICGLFYLFKCTMPVHYDPERENIHWY